MHENRVYLHRYMKLITLLIVARMRPLPLSVLLAGLSCLGGRWWVVAGRSSTSGVGLVRWVAGGLRWVVWVTGAAGLAMLVMRACGLGRRVVTSWAEAEAW